MGKADGTKNQYSKGDWLKSECQVVQFTHLRRKWQERGNDFEGEKW